MAYCKLISQADLVSSYVDNTATKTGEKVSWNIPLERDSIIFEKNSYIFSKR